MKSNEYAFVTRWRVRGTCREVSDILANAPDLVRWWPSVYLDVQELEAGDARGIGKVVSLYTKGWLPYTLRWQFRVTESQAPYGFALEAWGDLTGYGRWQLAQDGNWVDITYDWRVSADKPLLRWFSFIMKPILAANHHWAMRQGEASLKLELKRRWEGTAVAPPPPTFCYWIRKA